MGGTYIGTTRGNGSLPESVALVDEANARIMAAAPVMLAALKRQHENIQRWLSTGEAAGPEESREIAEQIANAIQAATMMESPDED